MSSAIRLSLHLHRLDHSSYIWADAYSDSEDEDLHPWRALQYGGSRSEDELYELPKRPEGRFIEVDPGWAWVEGRLESMTPDVHFEFFKRDRHSRLEHHNCDWWDDALDSLIGRDRKVRLELLRTCRQIFQEANPILWPSNTFSFDDPDSLKHFMANINHVQRQLLSKIRFHMDFSTDHEKRKWDITLIRAPLVASLKNLKTLHMYIEQGLIDLNCEPLSNAQEKLVTTITKLNIVPLQHVTVIIQNCEYGIPLNLLLPQEARLDWAERMMQKLLQSKMLPSGTSSTQGKEPP